MEIDFYQTIPEVGIKGRFNTPEEFDKIGLPEKIEGSVLDIGCNTGAYLIEAYKRGSRDLHGVEPNQIWRLLAQGIMWEFDRYHVIPNEGHPGFIFYESVDELYGEQFDLVLLLSVTHVVEGGVGQELLEKTWELVVPGGLMILEVNDRLQKQELSLPAEAKIDPFGKSKDNRSVYHLWKK